MKQELLKILNDELFKARNRLELARTNQNTSFIISWNHYKDLINKLIKRVQDEA